jgi:hypothetical protein
LNKIAKNSSSGFRSFEEKINQLHRDALAFVDHLVDPTEIQTMLEALEASVGVQRFKPEDIEAATKALSQVVERNGSLQSELELELKFEDAEKIVRNDTLPWEVVKVSKKHKVIVRRLAGNKEAGNKEAGNKEAGNKEAGNKEAGIYRWKATFSIDAPFEFVKDMYLNHAARMELSIEEFLQKIEIENVVQVSQTQRDFSSYIITKFPPPFKCRETVSASKLIVEPDALLAFSFSISNEKYPITSKYVRAINHGIHVYIQKREGACDFTVYTSIDLKGNFPSWMAKRLAGSFVKSAAKRRKFLANEFAESIRKSAPLRKLKKRKSAGVKLNQELNADSKQESDGLRKVQSIERVKKQ